MDAHELLNYKNWAVVGDVANSQKYAYRILNALKQAGFNAEGVNPRAPKEGIYKSIKDVPYKVEVIDLCINPAVGIGVMKEALDMGINKVLIQPGAGSEEILNYCSETGITAIAGCALVELSSYIRQHE